VEGFVGLRGCRGRLLHSGVSGNRVAALGASPQPCESARVLAADGHGRGTDGANPALPRSRNCSYSLGKHAFSASRGRRGRRGRRGHCLGSLGVGVALPSVGIERRCVRHPAVRAVRGVRLGLTSGFCGGIRRRLTPSVPRPRARAVGLTLWLRIRACRSIASPSDRRCPTARIGYRLPTKRVRTPIGTAFIAGTSDQPSSERCPLRWSVFRLGTVQTPRGEPGPGVSAHLPAPSVISLAGPQGYCCIVLTCRSEPACLESSTPSG
jgi:hypothetical protein